MRALRFIPGIVLFASVLCAQTQQGMIYSFYTGFSKPGTPSDFQKNWRSGYSLGAGLGRTVTPRLQTHLNFDYSNYALDDRNYMQSQDLVSAETVIEGGTISIATLYLDLKYLYPTPAVKNVTPYLVAGAGLFYLHNEEMRVYSGIEDVIHEASNEAALGAGLGIGFNIYVEGVTSLFVEVRFNLGLTETETTVILPIKLGFSIH